jgi:hypothetical protein
MHHQPSFKAARVTARKQQHHQCIVYDKLGQIKLIDQDKWQLQCNYARECKAIYTFTRWHNSKQDTCLTGRYEVIDKPDNTYSCGIIVGLGT